MGLHVILCSWAKVTSVINVNKTIFETYGMNESKISVQEARFFEYIGQRPLEKFKSRYRRYISARRHLKFPLAFCRHKSTLRISIGTKSRNTHADLAVVHAFVFFVVHLHMRGDVSILYFVPRPAGNAFPNI